MRQQDCFERRHKELLRDFKDCLHGLCKVRDEEDSAKVADPFAYLFFCLGPYKGSMSTLPLVTTRSQALRPRLPSQV